MVEKYLNKRFFKENEHIRTLFCNANREQAMHSHEFWEFVYIYEGQGKNHTLSQTENVKSNEFFLIKPGEAHALVSLPKKDGAILRICNCLFTQEYFSEILKKCSEIFGVQEYAFFKLLNDDTSFCLHLSDDGTKNIKHIVWLIAHEYNHFTTGSEEIIKNSMVNLIVSVSRLYEKELNKENQTATDDVIDELIHYITTNFGFKITLEDLAMRVHLSREYLSRYFKQRTGKNIWRFLLDVRMDNAKQKLISTYHSVSDISEYCGYRSVSNFQKTFKKETGLSPSDYRKKYMVKEPISSNADVHRF